MTRRGLAGAAAVLGCVLPIGAAEASGLTLERCEHASDGRPCAVLAVPLDRSGAVAGSVQLHVERYRAKRPTRPPVVALVGRPGQSVASALSTPSSGLGWDPVEMLVGEERRRRDVVLVDLRGSGRSGPLDCPELQRAHAGGAVARCAARLGPGRDRYLATDMAEDVEAVRAAIGAERIALLGASYGGDVALAYARRHPTRVERLVLDSPVGPLGIDGLSRSSLNAIPRYVKALCGSSGECESFTRDAGADLSRVAAQVESRTLRDLVTVPGGDRRPVSLDGAGLVRLVQASDDDPLLAATLPGALRRGAQGDPAPLLRLAWAEGRNEATERAVPASDLSGAARLAILCSEAALPWPPTTPLADRPAVALASAELRGAGAFAPFGARTAAGGELVRACAEWPSATRWPPVPPPLPDVPTLILSGTGDMHAPTEDARALAVQLPRAQLSIVGHAGHPVLSYVSDCPTEVVERFLAGRVVEPCDDERWWHGVLPPPPSEFRDLATRGMRPRVGRTASAVLWTAVDLATAFAQRARPALEEHTAGRGRRALRLRLGALRGGTYVLGPGRIRIRRARVVPGVVVSGHVRSLRVRVGDTEQVRFRGRRRQIVSVPHYDDRVRVRLRVRGRLAAHGWLELRHESELVGRLDGRRVRIDDLASRPLRFAPDIDRALELWSPDLLRDREPAPKRVGRR